MNYTLVILGVLLIFIAGYVLKKIEGREPNPEEKAEEDIEDLNDSFLEKAKGKSVISLVKIYNPYDRVVIRSILKSEGIETYVKSNIFGELYPTYDIHNFSTSIIQIFEEDRDIAKQIVQDYLLTLDKKNYQEKENPMDNIRITSSAVMGVPPKLSKFKPELLID